MVFPDLLDQTATALDSVTVLSSDMVLISSKSAPRSAHGGRDARMPLFLAWVNYGIGLDSDAIVHVA